MRREFTFCVQLFMNGLCVQQLMKGLVLHKSSAKIYSEVLSVRSEIAQSNFNFRVKSFNFRVNKTEMCAAIWRKLVQFLVENVENFINELNG